MTLLTKYKQQQQEMEKNLFRVSIGGKRTRTGVVDDQIQTTKK